MALIVSGLYTVFGFAWIVLSDLVVHRIARDPEQSAQIQSIKGWLFVLLSAVLLYVVADLLRRHLDREWKRARHADERFRLAIELTGTGLWDITMDPDRPHEIPDRVFLSPSLKALLGFGPGELPDSYAAWQDRIHPEDRVELRRLTAEHVAARAPVYEARYRIRHRDGSWRWIQSVGRITRDARGRPLRWTGFDRDVTAQAEVEFLRRQYFDVAGMLLVATDREGRVTLANRRALRTLDCPEEDVVGHDWAAEFTPPEDVDRVRSLDQRAFTDVVDLDEYQEYRVRTRTGTLRLIGWHHVMLRDAAEQPVGILRSGQDITEQRAAVQSLRESEGRLRQVSGHLRAVIESSPVPLILMAPDGVVQLWSPAAERAFGWSAAEAVGRLNPLVPTERVDEYEAHLGEVRGGREVVGREVVCRRKDGTAIPVSLSLAPVRDDHGAITAVFGAVEDISARKAAEGALRDSEARLRIALTAGHHGLFDLNVQTGEAFIGDEYARVIGYDPGELEETVERWWDRLHPDDRASALRAFDDYVAGRRPEYRVEVRQRTKHGDWRWVLSTGAIVEWTPDGRPLRLLGTHTDIDRDRRREAALVRAHRAVHLRTEVTRLMAQAGGEDVLYEGVCRLAIELAGYRLAWLGRVGEPPACLVEPVVIQGDGEAYVRDAHVTWADEPAGRGPTGTAIRTGAIQVARDLAAEPWFAPWRDAARARGYVASAAVPIRVTDRVEAVLNLYADTPEAFDVDEVALLADLGRDLASGIRALRQQEQLRRLAALLEAAREAERARISQELHDELGQALTGLKLDLSWVRDRVSRKPAGAAKRVDAALHLVDQTVDAVRRIAAELRPGVLDDLGLEAAMRWQARDFQKRTGCSVSIEPESALPDVPPDIATAAFRILQEALTNVTRHAHATAVTIRFGAAAGRLHLAVEDNGVGLPDVPPDGRRGLGLAGMRERAWSHGGTLEIVPGLTGGTHVRCTLPLSGP
jgi:PAS domain S-box-containing protein